jgi:hypothetical protein
MESGWKGVLVLRLKLRRAESIDITRTVQVQSYSKATMHPQNKYISMVNLMLKLLEVLGNKHVTNQRNERAALARGPSSSPGRVNTF